MKAKISKGEKTNILKTATTYPTCISDHQRVIKNSKKCWLARLGRDVASQPLINRNGYFFLYQHGDLFIAHFNEIEKNKPETDFPDSYEKYVYGKGKEPYEYVLLDYLEQVPTEILCKLHYEGNGRTVSDTITRSPKAYMTVVADEDISL